MTYADAMPFTGFASADPKFFRALAKNQTREWFAAHKQELEEGWTAPMRALLDEVHAKVDASFPHCDLAEPKMFRIFRDVRFSKDKSPYKTHVAGFLTVKRKVKTPTDLPMALYFHVGLPKSFAAAGHYMMDAQSLRGFRAAVADDKRGRELDKLLTSLAKKGFTIGSYDRYKRIPRGFDADHPRAEHLKRKGLTVTFPELPKGILSSPKLAAWLVGHIKTSAPLVEWLAFATA